MFQIIFAFPPDICTLKFTFGYNEDLVIFFFKKKVIRNRRITCINNSLLLVGFKNHVTSKYKHFDVLVSDNIKSNCCVGTSSTDFSPQISGLDCKFLKSNTLKKSCFSCYYLQVASDI